MLDLRNEKLQDSIEVGGKSYKLKTNFRAWIGFSHLFEDAMDNNLAAERLLSYFEEIPLGLEDFQTAFNELCKFYNNPSATPNSLNDTNGNKEKLFDFIDDGEYIYASFMQVYNIDLLSVKLHWHVFQALFRGLPETCKISQIMGFRGYAEDNLGMKERYERSKRIWSLSNKGKQERNAELIKEINDEFYGCV